MNRPLHIHYHRPPDRSLTYEQELVLDLPEVKVSFQPSTPLATVMQVGGRSILEPGSPVVWFTFPDRWHDIGRFHTADGQFTGLYANVLTPVRIEDGGIPVEWFTTDLYLDVWCAPGREPLVLDRDEWDAATRAGHINAATAERAEAEALRLVAAARSGTWPPAIVQEWTLERVLRG